MEGMSTHDADSALKLLAQAAVDRENDLTAYDADPLLSSSDEECDSESPIFDAFYDGGGSQSIVQMTNFSAAEFQVLWDSFSDHILENYNVGRGRRKAVKPRDAIFMILAVAKHGDHWDMLARTFQMKAPTFERIITKFLEMLYEEVNEKFVLDIADKWTMRRVLNCGVAFKTHKYARYATDVTFQQANRPSGNMEEGKRYYSGKHKLYGYKVEVSVLPVGFAIASSNHHAGSRSDIDIFHRMEAVHTRLLNKSDNDRDIADIGPGSEKYPNSWAVIADKGYQGAKEFIRTICPKKKPPHGVLSLEDESNNKRLSSDRIIVENFFGRMCGLWSLMSSKYR